MDEHISLQEEVKKWHGSLKAYLIGFTLSLILTAASFSLVLLDLLSGKILIVTLVVLGVVQALTQLVFFLHVGKDPKPKWETIVTLFMILVLLIIAFGSLWIMYDLNDRVMKNM